MMCRDIKTANILIADTDLYKLCDFGSCFVIEVAILSLSFSSRNQRGTRSSATDHFVEPTCTLRRNRVEGSNVAAPTSGVLAAVCTR